MIFSEYNKIYVLRNKNTNKIIYKNYFNDKSKLVFVQRKRAQTAMNELLKRDPSLNISIEELYI